MLSQIVGLAGHIAVREYTLELELYEFEEESAEDIQADIDQSQAQLNELIETVTQLKNNSEVTSI